MENKLKDLLFIAIDSGKIESFTSEHLKLECHGSTITISWKIGLPKNEITWHYIHPPISYLQLSSCVPSNDEVSTLSYKITFENGLTYDVPMTVVESDKLTSLLSDAFQKYQEHTICSTIKHWDIYSKPDAFDDLLEEPTHAN